MKQILAIPKLAFDNNFEGEDFSKLEHMAFISILDIDNNEKKYDTSQSNFLQVKMWDIESDLFEDGKLKYEKPSEEELTKIVLFIMRNSNKKVFVIHCSAGISRSGAVATFLYDKFYDEVEKDRFRRENKNIQPNLFILNSLKRIDESDLIHISCSNFKGILNENSKCENCGKSEFEHKF